MKIMEHSNKIRVGIGEANIVNSPGEIIAVGLGSCIGIALYDKSIALGGLAHIILPDSTQFNKVNNPFKFANLAIPLLLNIMEKEGAKKKNITAKIVGGASMFNFADKNKTNDIGNRNEVAVRQSLSELSIPIISTDVGGNKGRTMILDTSSGIVYIRTIGIGIKEL
ncbi:chemotaxis protein CheD [Clostridium putrefaciens]|nr:chemotaxis protein CheD [Clostridium putrefaciens]